MATGTPCGTHRMEYEYELETHYPDAVEAI